MYLYPPPSRLDLLDLEVRLRSAAVGWIRRAVIRPGTSNLDTALRLAGLVDRLRERVDGEERRAA